MREKKCVWVASFFRNSYGLQGCSLAMFLLLWQIKNEVRPGGYTSYSDICLGGDYFFSQAFSHSAFFSQVFSHAFWHSAFFSHASWHSVFFSHAFSQFAFLGQVFWQESFFSQVVQSIWQESTISQAALQQASLGHAVVHSVAAFSHVAFLHFLLQHEVKVRAAMATNANNTFFIFFLFRGLIKTFNLVAKIHAFL